MRDDWDRAKSTLSGIAALFLILWFISAVTDLIGQYEYEVEFLQLAVGFYLLSRIPTAFRERYTARKKIQKFFYNLGWPLVGLWVGFRIFRWIGWFGPMEIEVNIDYFLVAGIILLLIGYAVKSSRQKARYWAARSVFITIGLVGIFFWILIKVFNIFPEYADLVMVAGIVAIGIGFILGGFRKPPAFLVDIEEEEYPEPAITEDVYVTEKDVTINRDRTRVKLNTGSLFVPITAGKETGAIFFGEGSYQVDAQVKTYQDVYRGVTLVSGSDWDSVRKDVKIAPANDEAFENIGLEKEEVLEIARLQIKGKLTDELRRKLKSTSVDLPFIKVRETPHGGYVKVGPIEVEEEREEEHVRIGPWYFKSSGKRHALTRHGLFIQIRSKDEDITIFCNGKTILTRGNTHITVNDKIVVREGDIDLVVEDDRKLLRSDTFKLVCRDDRRVIHSNGFELSVTGERGRIRKNGKSTLITDEKILEEIRIEIDAVVDELIKEVLDQGELKELDALIKKFEQELS